VLPSFWADIWSMPPNHSDPAPWQWILGGVGTFFGLLLIGFAVLLMIPAWSQRKRIWAMFRKLYSAVSPQ